MNLDKNDYHVHGTVADASGKGLAGVKVALQWQRIRERVPIAQGQTDAAGNYAITYRIPDNAPGKVVLLVQASGGALATALESPQTVAAPDLTVNLNVAPADPSQHGTLLAAVTPLLQGMSLPDVVESGEHRDISFLASETGNGSEQLMRLAVAARLEQAFKITAEAWFAFLVQRVPASLPSSLLAASQDFTLIDVLVQHVAALIAGVDAAQQTSTLQAAVSSGLVPQSITPQIGQIVEALQLLRRTNLLGNPYQSGKTTLGQLLGTAKLAQDKQTAFARALIDNTQPLEQFWATLADGRHGFTADEVASVRQTLSIGAFVKNSLPLVTALAQGFTSGTYKSLSDLARLSKADWLELIQRTGTASIPSNMTGADAAETFAQETYDRITAAYPTVALSMRIASFVTSAQQGPLGVFFANNPTLDLRRDNVEIYLKQAGDAAFKGIPADDKAAAISNVKAMQRVLRISPHVDMAQTLLATGLSSAAGVAMMGREQFAAKMVHAGVVAADAYKMYAQACTRYAGAIAMYARFNQPMAGPWPHAFGPKAPDGGMIGDAIARNATLKALFGSQDYCEVDDCTSILSPAAYLTDLLLWLSRRTAGIAGFPNALAVLDARRRDLVNLLLNCPNTNTPLPYIDVVNELLADTISPPMPATWRQTTLSAEQLRAAPDPLNANPGADTALLNAVYPRMLPYDPSLDLLRRVLAKSNVALWQLRQAYLPLHGAPTAAQLAPIAGERFSISLQERGLITTAATPALLPRVWNTANPVADLAPVDAFLAAAGLSYEQLLELKEVVWARGGGGPLQILGINDQCDTSKESLAPLDAGRLDLIHRFLRLWARTGWKMWELDLLLTAPGIGDPTLASQTLVNLFAVRQLLDATGLSVVELLAFYGPIDTASHREPDGTETIPFYGGLFLNPSFTPDPALQPMNLNGAVDLDAHANAIQAALQLSAADTGTLLGLTDNHRTLDNLSLIYRVATLARVLKLSLIDMQAIGPTPITNVFATPDATLAFVQRAKTIASAGFTVDQMNYALTTSPAKAGITDAQIAATLASVSAAIQKVQQAVYGGGDPPFTMLSQQIAQLPPSSDPSHPSLSDTAQMKTALAIVNGSFTGGDPARTNFIDTQFAFFMNAAQLANAVATLTALGSPATGAALDARANLVLQPLVQYLTQKQAIAVVASALSIAADSTSYLMNTLVVPQIPASTETLLVALTDPGLLLQPIPAALQTAANNSIRLLNKIGFIAAQLHLVAGDLTWLVPNAALYGGVDFAKLPIVAGQANQSIDQWLATVLLVQLNRTFNALKNTTLSPPPAVTSLTTLLSAVASNAIATDAAVQAAFAGISGAPASDIASLASSIGMTLAAGDWTKLATYDRLRVLVQMSNATNGSGSALGLWAAEAIPMTLAAVAALAAIKGATSNASWLALVQSFNDPLREARRDALVAYLVSQRNTGALPWTPMAWGDDSDSLFDYFLIDTQMCSCMDTSRVVQAYETVQLFVERCLMNLEPAVSVDASKDEGWGDWNWRQRYRLWQADREVFLWPENWLVEADRPNRSEIFDTLIQEVRQTNGTADALEPVVLNYIDRLGQIAHLRVCGMCQDHVTGATHVVACTHSDPPAYYHRKYLHNAWTPWTKIPLNIKSHQVVPVVHRRCLYLFWIEVVVANEPQQTVPAAQPSTSSSVNPPPARHVEIRVGASSYRNDKWAPAAHAGGTLYDAPLILLDPRADTTQRAIEALYSIKVNLPTSINRAELWVDVFRYKSYSYDYAEEMSWTDGNSSTGAAIGKELLSGVFQYLAQNFDSLMGYTSFWIEQDVWSPTYFGRLKLDVSVQSTAEHIGRAVFDGRFEALQMRSLGVMLQGMLIGNYLAYAQAHYGHEAEKLTELSGVDGDLLHDAALVPKTGALVTLPIVPGASSSIPLNFNTAVSPYEQNAGPLLWTAQAPYAVVGPDTDLQFDPSNDFIYSDHKRAYFVEAVRWYEYGSQWRPVAPSNPSQVPFQIRYTFHRFYHPYTNLFWHEIFKGGLPALYQSALQASPASADPSYTNPFSFPGTYSPVATRVRWGEDGEIIDFKRSAPYSVYNWELFFHLPYYVAQSLKNNQQFDDALAWLQYIFNPTAPGPLPEPQRFWVTLPFSTLTTAQVAKQDIDNLLAAVNQNDPDAVGQVLSWQASPFNPFLVADMRPVAYMKAVVIAYVNTLIAKADHLFATASRENLSEATLLLVRASEIMGPLPDAVPPSARADASFLTLQPDLDAFANAMVEIENVLPAGDGGAGGGGGPLPAPETFYFKIPPNTRLLNVWQTIDDRLYKLRHCLSLTGEPLALPLFDAPLDPGLLAAAEAAGVDLSSILGDISAPLPNYRYDVLYGQATKFCDTVRTFGSQLLAALEKKDADVLALLLPTLQQQLLVEQNQIFQWQVDAANERLAAIGQSIAVQQLRNGFYTQHASQFVNDSEQTSIDRQNLMLVGYELIAAEYVMAGILFGIPNFLIGASGFGGSPVASGALGGRDFGEGAKAGANFMKTLGTIFDRQAKLGKEVGGYRQRQDKWNEQASEAQIEIERLTHEQSAADFAVQIATQQQTDHQTMIDNLQQQIDFLTNKFTNSDLYDWLASKLSDVYFQSYRMAYAMAKRAERTYQYELALPSASFIQFGYWDTLHKGLLAGESLMTDLHRMHASYLDLNVRRYEVSRIVSLASLPAVQAGQPVPILQLLATGACDFELPESLYDGDYPGQYQRQLKRVSVTVVYTNPGKNDNVMCKFTLVKNQVRMNTNLNTVGDPYAESPIGNDTTRFAYQYGAVQSVVTSQAQDDPGLFENQIHYQISDPRYLPFEGAGAISDWHLELPPNNQIDVATVSDVLIHVLYTALDGGPDFAAKAASWARGQPQFGTKLFSAANDFSAPAATAATPYPVTPWQAFLAVPAAGADQVLTLSISSSKFPIWTRGKKIAITGMKVHAVSWSGGAFLLQPQAPLPAGNVPLNAPGLPNLLASGTVTLPAAGISLGTWSFKLQVSGAANFQSLTSSQIGDLMLELQFTAN